MPLGDIYLDMTLRTSIRLLAGSNFITREHVHNSVQYIIGFVRLFAHYGTPTHGVVVGMVK